MYRQQHTKIAIKISYIKKRKYNFTEHGKTLCVVNNEQLQLSAE